MTDPKAWDPTLWNLARAQDQSGENVTEYTALNYSAIFNAVSLISGTVSTLPLPLNRKEDRKTIPVKKSPLYHVLHDQANPYMTAMGFREVGMAHVLLWGNSFAEIVRNRFGEVVELWPITPNRVRIKMQDGKLTYIVSMEREQDITLPRERVLHVPGLGFNGFGGYSIVGLAAKSIGLGMAMETFGSRFFGSGTHPGVIVSHPGKLSPEGGKKLQDSLTGVYSGLGQSHRLMLLEENMKIEKVTIPNNDSQFLESRQFQIPEIARWFNLPPHKLKDLTKSSFSNIESEQISFYTDSILPWLVRLEQNYQSQLLTQREREQGYYFKHAVQGLLRGSAADRSAYYRTMWHMGAMSQNDIREKEDMDPIEGGDQYFVPANMIPLDQAGKNVTPPGQQKLPLEAGGPTDLEWKETPAGPVNGGSNGRGDKSHESQ